MSTPLRETTDNEASVGALISAAIIGAMIVLTLYGYSAAEARNLQVRQAEEIQWNAPNTADSVPQGGSEVDSTLVPAGGISR